MRKYLYLERLPDQEDKIVEVNINAKEDDSTEIIKYMSNKYKESYGAKVTPNPDLIIYITNTNDNRIMACAGVSIGSNDTTLFSERYLTGSLLYETLLKHHKNIKITEILEIGSLASNEPKYASLLIKLLPLLSWNMGLRVIICTTTKQLRTLFKYYKIPFEYICESSPDVLTDSERNQWGSYYDNSPQLVSISLDCCGHLFNRYCGQLVFDEVKITHRTPQEFEECA